MTSSRYHGDKTKNITRQFEKWNAHHSKHSLFQNALQTAEVVRCSSITLENWAQVFYIINSVTSKSGQNKFKSWRVRKLILGQLLIPNFWTFWNKEDSWKCWKVLFQIQYCFNCQNSRKIQINFNKSPHFYTWCQVGSQ